MSKNASMPAPAPRRRRDLHGIVDALLASYRADARGHHINKRFLPSREEIDRDHPICLLQLFYPGYFGRQDLSDEDLRLPRGHAPLDAARQARASRSSAASASGRGRATRAASTSRGAGSGGATWRRASLERLPDVRDASSLDVQAAYDGDPAAASTATRSSSPIRASLAVTVHRVAHELYVLGVPLMPRIMTEWAHTRTGADIHPGANDRRQLLHRSRAPASSSARPRDIGEHVKLYQGVTLGALSLAPATRAARHPRHEAPPHRRGRRHHLRERHGARRQDGAGAGERGGRLGVPDEERRRRPARRDQGARGCASPRRPRARPPSAPPSWSPSILDFDI